jgi:long-chain fatty acid transport protein
MARQLLRCLALTLVALLAGAPAAWAQQGVSIAGTGPINLSFGGASTAAPLDAAGALYWNPATLVGLEHNELSTGLALILPQTRLSSGIAPSALVPGIPPPGFSGSERGDNGVTPLPNFAFAYKSEDDSWAVALGAFPVGGFETNFPASRDNPIVSARPPFGLAQGGIYAQLQVIDLLAAGSIRLTDRLSFGFSPKVALSFLQEDPGIAAPLLPTSVIPTYPPLTHTRLQWSAGFNAGLYYEIGSGWRTGLSFRSPQWGETFKFHTADRQGRPIDEDIPGTFPMIISAGVSYCGFERWLFAADFRYLDYRNAPGFGQGGLNPDGSITGLGWRSIFALALGAQYQLTDSTTLRMGYTFNQNPIPDQFAWENAGSILVEKHSLYLGATYRMFERVLVSAAYIHVFGNSVTGPIRVPGLGPVPESFVKDELTGVDALVMGFTVQF